MRLFKKYFTVYVFSTVVGCLLMTYGQYIYIHGLNISDWIKDFPIIFLIIALLASLVLSLVYFTMKPLNSLLENVNQRRSIEEEEEEEEEEDNTI